MTGAAPIAELPARILAAQLPLDAAWGRVRAKAGMPGVDGLSVGRFTPTAEASLRTLEHQLASGTYAPLPLRLAELEKKDGGRRTLLVPAVRDRIAQAAVASWLGAKWNPSFDSASFAYRPGLGVRSALRHLRDLHRAGYRWVFDADIRQCFDSFDHHQLFDRLDRCLGQSSPLCAWIRTWVGSAVWDGLNLYRVTTGIPQGSPLSPLLANFYLDDFDRSMRSAGVKFIRYADDFLVLARSPFDLATARRHAKETLGRLGLSLKPEKTRTTSFDKWFRFLGAEIRGDDILLPFEKVKTPLAPVFVAPRMPPALLRAWQAGHLHARTPLTERPRAIEPPRHVTPVLSRRPRVLTSLAGQPQPLRRSHTG